LLVLLRLVWKFERAVCRNLDEARYESGPTGLMTGADSGAVVAVKVFVEEQQIPPVRVLLELFGAAMDGAGAILAGEDADQAPRDLGAHLLQVHEPAGARRAFDLEIRSKIAVPAV
jgi:hypothetical protein